MTLLQTIIVGRILLLVALASLCLGLALSPTVSRRLRILGLVVLVGALIGYANFGALHPRGSGYRSGPIHYYDAFHYFMGAKYFPEVGYSGLYEATLMAAHDLGALRAIAAVRDLMTYTVRPAGAVDADAVRARFSKERWRQFKDDLVFFGSRIDAVAGAAPRSRIQRSAAASPAASRAGRSAARDVPDAERGPSARCRPCLPSPSSR